MLNNAALLVLTIACGASGAGATDTQTTTSHDKVLLSVGKLHVPGQRYENGYARHYDEDCSATLVSDREHAPSSSLIVSAWHCLEFYRDISKPLTFETSRGDTRKAQLISSGGGMHSDWALLRLDAPLPSPVVLADHKDQAAEALLMAGFPRRTSSQTKILETASNCSVTGSDGRDTRSNCVLQKGASGGAVFSRGTESQYLGVISRGDGESQSIYVPLSRFRANINAYLKSVRLP